MVAAEVVNRQPTPNSEYDVRPQIMPPVIPAIKEDYDSSATVSTTST